MEHPFRAAAWIGAYVLLAVAPLLLSLIQLDPGRSFWVNLSVSLGFVGLAVLGLQFVLVARITQLTTAFGIDVVLQVHRQMTVLIAGCIFAHPLILMVWDHRYLGLLDIAESPVRAKFALASVLLLMILVVTTVGRRRFRLPYRIWLKLHAGLAVVVVATALVHVLLIGYYVREPWERTLWIVYSAAFISVGTWVRLVRPYLRWRRRWRVVEIRPQPAGHTIVLTLVNPESYGPGGFRFRAGQFAWINTGRPFSMDYHPFSISSSAARPDAVEFTIKTEDGWTRGVERLNPGQTVYLDGPWGHFTVDRHEGPGFVFIGAGVGVTPLLSMVTTLADQDDKRPCWVILGYRRESEMMGFAEFQALVPRLPLTVTATLSEADADWPGHRGRIDSGLLASALPESRSRLQYFICGPELMMNTAEQALADLGVPRGSIHSERFAMV